LTQRIKIRKGLFYDLIGLKVSRKDRGGQRTATLRMAAGEAPGGVK
jgi:hypothetical protein